MRNIILTGMPGSGKTSVIEELKKIGYKVVTEAATDLIKEKQNMGDLKPWENPNFIEDIHTFFTNKSI
jgi:predicted ATPase